MFAEYAVYCQNGAEISVIDIKNSETKTIEANALKKAFLVSLNDPPPKYEDVAGNNKYWLHSSEEEIMWNKVDIDCSLKVTNAITALICTHCRKYTDMFYVCKVFHKWINSMS